MSHVSETQTLSSPAEAVTPSSSPCDSLDVSQLSRYLESLVQSDESEVHVLNESLRVMRGLIGASAVSYFGLDSTRQLGSDPLASCPTTLAQSTINQLFAFAIQCLQANRFRVGRVKGINDYVVVGTPVFRHDGVGEALLAILQGEAADAAQLHRIAQTMQLFGAYFGQWRLRRGSSNDASVTSDDSQLLAVIARAQQTNDFAEAVEEYARYVSESLGGAWVGVGSRKMGGQCRLVAVSDGVPFKRGAPLVAWTETAMAEAMVSTSREGVITQEPSVRETDAVRQLQTLTQRSVIARWPIVSSEGKAIGAIVAASKEPLAAYVRERIERDLSVIGPQIELVQRSRKRHAEKLWSSIQRQSPSRRRAMIASSLVIFALLAAFPLPHRVKCRGDVQPVASRFIAAPYEGRLEQVLVEPGDMVKSGQVIAVMDSRDIEQRISILLEELTGHEADRARFIADRDMGLAAAIEPKVDAVRKEIELFESRLADLSIRSPMDGVVIGGDPKKLEGARLTMGQSIVEVGRLGEMVFEVAVPDEVVDEVEVGRRVKFRLDSMPMTSFYGELTRLHPRSEHRAQENVFVGEVTINGDTASLRPGMQGRAKISAPARPALWILFHRAWEAVLFRFGW